MTVNLAWMMSNDVPVAVNVAYRLLVMRNDGTLPQERIAQSVGEQQHICWSDELELEGLPKDVICDHFAE